MTKQIRVGVFETNSSSTHSITICSPEDFKKLKEGTCTNQDLIESYKNMQSSYLESYDNTYKTPKGEEIVIFGNYGYDG